MKHIETTCPFCGHRTVVTDEDCYEVEGLRAYLYTCSGCKEPMFAFDGGVSIPVEDFMGAIKKASFGGEKIAPATN